MDQLFGYARRVPSTHYIKDSLEWDVIHVPGERKDLLPGGSSEEKDLPKEGKFEVKIEQWKIDVDPNPHSFRLQLHQEPLISPASVSIFLYPRDSVVLGCKLWSLCSSTSSTNLLPALQRRRTISSPTLPSEDQVGRVSQGTSTLENCHQPQRHQSGEKEEMVTGKDKRHDLLIWGSWARGTDCIPDVCVTLILTPWWIWATNNSLLSHIQ